MSGDIETIRTNNIRKFLPTPMTCLPNHSNFSNSLSSTEHTSFTASVSTNENSSNGLLSSVISDVCDKNDIETSDGIISINQPDSVISSLGASSNHVSPIMHTNYDVGGVSVATNESGITSGSSIYDMSVSANIYLPQTPIAELHPALTDASLLPPRIDRFDGMRLTDNSNEFRTDDISFLCGETQNNKHSFKNSVVPTETDNVTIPTTLHDLHPSQANMETRLSKDRDLCNLPGMARKSSLRNLQAFLSNDSECNSIVDQDVPLSSSVLWTKSGTNPDDLNSFTYSAESSLNTLMMPSQMDVSGLSSENGLNPGGSGSNSLLSNGSTAAATAAAKRAITGSHQQQARFGMSLRPNTTWSGNVMSGGPQIPSVNTVGGGYAWNMGSAPVPKTNIGQGGSSSVNMMQTQNTSPSGSGQSSSWAYMLSQHGQQKPSTQNVTNMLGSLSLNNGGVGNNGIRTGSLTSQNKGVPGNGITNMYNMFPKRPQHRMMALWQQQQQHNQQQQASLQLQNQLGRITNSLNTNSICSRMPVNNIDIQSANMTSNDNGNIINYSGNFGGVSSSGCSILHSLSTTSHPQPVNSSLGLNTHSDCFSSNQAIMQNSSNGHNSLDNFKFGLDQQIMETIKSMDTGMTNASSNHVGDLSATNTFPGCLDDILPSFAGDIDTQYSNPVAMNHLSLLGSSNNVSNGSGLGGGLTCHLNGNNNHPSSLNALSNCGGGTGVGGNATLFNSVGVLNPYQVFSSVPMHEEGYSRKVFVGGLPPDIDEEEITTAFRRFGHLIVDWPHKTESKAYFPPKGYCFLLFQDERSVQSLISACIVDEGKYYWCVSSPTMKDKPVQIRPWNLADSDFVMDGSQPLDLRKTIFVGGVPRPLRAIELASIMDRLYGGVCYAGIDTDPELKYPKGAGRVAFSNQQSYIAAISARFVQLQHNEIDKRVEVKPYVLDNQMCDECQGARCGSKFAPFFCANVACLQYYCEQCWVQIHSRNGREFHRPLVKEGSERPRQSLYR